MVEYDLTRRYGIQAYIHLTYGPSDPHTERRPRQVRYSTSRFTKRGVTTAGTNALRNVIVLSKWDINYG